MMEDQLVNRVAQSALKTLNLEDWYPAIVLKNFDLKDYLFQGLILREKEFRQALKDIDWTSYQDSMICIYCSSDAIIPMWAYMLVASYAQSAAAKTYVGTPADYLTHYFKNKIDQLDPTAYTDQKLVIKGCSNKPVPPGAYAAIVEKLQATASSIMFGEPCSTVPIYKKPK